MMSTPTEKTNLLNFDDAQLQNFFQTLGEKSFRARQVMQWIHYFGVTDFSLMTNLSKSLQQRLADTCVIQLPEVETCQRSADGTCKWLIKLSCGNCIETVYIPERTRGTLCVSSQVGCALNCSFCSTAKQGFNRNLTTAEIIGQVWIAARTLSADKGRHDKKITNVVMMGMGEPLLNFDAVVSAMKIMLDDFAYGLSKRRVTLSTSGVLPELKRLYDAIPVSLAVSLHAPTDDLRDILVPINKKYPVKELLDVCRTYFASEPRRKVTFEYVMLKGINDQPHHAKALARVLKDVPAKINLIPFNPFPLIDYECSAPATIEAFKAILMAQDINTTVRKTRGDDIDAACGQLAGEVADRTRRAAQWQKMHFVGKVNKEKA